MKTNIKVLIGITAVLVLAAVLFLIFPQKSGSAQASVDRAGYQIGEKVELTVENGFNREICFSSCYPYIMEIQNKKGEWEEYVYQDCASPDRAIDCVPARALKKFRIAPEDAEIGVHRLKIPVCFDCLAGQSFGSDQALYSGTFIISR